MSTKLFSQNDIMRNADIPGLDNQLVIEETGKGDITLVMIHGLGSSSKAFSKMRPLLENNFRVISFDLPGYGINRDAGQLYGMTSYATMIKDLIEKENWKNVVLVGHSMGGQIALKLATEFSGLKWLRGLYLIAPAGIETFGEMERQWFNTYTSPDIMLMLTDDQIKKNFDINFAGGVLPEDALFMFEDRISLKDDSLSYNKYLKAVSANISSMLDEPVYEDIGSIEVPVSIVYGMQDNLIPNRILHPEMDLEFLKQGLKMLAPSVSFKILDGGGHFLVWDKSAELAHDLKSFTENIIINQH